MKSKRHLIFGAGLIGNYLAGCFLSKDLDVTLLGRASMQEKLQNGLVIAALSSNKLDLGTPKFVLESSDVFDVIWLTVKCTATAAVITDLKKVVGPKSIIVCCQNGFGSDAVIREAFADNVILTAVFGPNVALIENDDGSTYFNRATEGKFAVESHPELDPLFLKVNSPLLAMHSSEDIVAEQWAKLQLNLANAVNALSDVPVKTMIETAGYRKIIVALMRELLAVTDAQNIELPKVSAVPGHWLPRIMSLPNWAFLRVAQKMLAIDPAAKTSMCWDLHAGRITEIEYLNGALVRQANKLGIDCPVNTKIVDLVHQVESKQASIGFSAKDLHARLM